MEKLIFPANVEIGKFYKVPHILVCYLNGVKNVWIPISTPLHEDEEIIGFKYYHYHIDWRFIPKRIYKKMTEFNNLQTVMMQVKDVVIAAGKEIAWNVVENSGIIYKKVQAKRNFLANEFHKEHRLYYIDWPIELQRKYCGQELRKNADGNYICPHKGALIDPSLKDENGNIICYAHLLKFDAETKKAVNV